MLKCPFCQYGKLYPGDYKAQASFSCNKCSALIVFRESYEEKIEEFEKYNLLRISSNKKTV
jgi:hypothetical protein